MSALFFFSAFLDAVIDGLARLAFFGAAFFVPVPAFLLRHSSTVSL